MTNEIKRKRGRPKKEGPHFNRQIKINVTEDQVYMKHALEKEMGKTGNEVMREALELLYNMKIGWK